MTKKIMPVLFSVPINERLELPARAEILPKIESGEIEHLDFDARVFGTQPNRNHYTFKAEDMPAFAASFEGKPFLRNHDTYDIGARDGTIAASRFEGEWILQTIRLTTRRGMTDLVEGRIDRFSIGWFQDDVICSICNSSWLACPHSPGRQYDTLNGKKTCTLIITNPVGKETSAVNANAVDGTSILSELQEYKLEVFGAPAVTHAPRASQPLTKGGQMKKKAKVKVINPETQEVSEVEGEIVEPSLQERLESNSAAAEELLGAHERQQALDAQLQESDKTLAALSGHLLDVGLSASPLPTVTQARIRKQFEDHKFEPAELSAAIGEAREEVSALTAPGSIQGPARIGAMYSSTDQFRLAVEDMFGMAREPGEAAVKVHRLRGIQDAYLMATGDQQFMGGYYAEFALVTANFPGIVANVMNKMLVKAWADFESVYGWWKKIVTVEHFTNLNTVTWVRTGTIASLPTVAERGEYL